MKLPLLVFACFGIVNAQTPPGSAPPNFERPISWGSIVPDIVADQSRIYGFPGTLNHRRRLLPALAVLGATAGLIALDGEDSGFFRRTSAFSGFNKAFNSTATQSAVLLTPAAFYAAGFLAGHNKEMSTALYSAQALADVGILDLVLKESTRRLRPSAFKQTGDAYDSFYDSPGSVLRNRSGFPSGHAITAFAVAGVVSHQYGKQHRWVACASYGLAALVGFSRVTLSAHFISDVFVGGALGYAVTKFVVLR